MLLSVKIENWLVGEQRVHLQSLLDGKYAVVDKGTQGRQTAKFNLGVL